MNEALKKLVWESLKAESQRAPVHLEQGLSGPKNRLGFWKPENLSPDEEQLFQKIIESCRQITSHFEVFVKGQATDFSKLWSISFGPRPFAALPCASSSGEAWQDFEFDGCHFRHYQAPQLSELALQPSEKKKLWNALKTAVNHIENCS